MSTTHVRETLVGNSELERYSLVLPMREVLTSLKYSIGSLVRNSKTLSLGTTAALSHLPPTAVNFLLKMLDRKELTKTLTHLVMKHFSVPASQKMATEDYINLLKLSCQFEV